MFQQEQVAIDAGSTVQQIAEFFKGNDKIQIIRKWTDDEQDVNFPLVFKNDEVYANFLNYVFNDSIDEMLNNSKPFVPEQDYGQQTRRIIGYLHPTTISDEVFAVSVKYKNEWLTDLYYTIDCAIQDRFFRKLKANEVAINVSAENIAK